MTLREFLVRQQTAYTTEVVRSWRENDKEYYRYMGKAFMCTDLMELLSDETLNMEVKTRAEALAKAKKKGAVCCRCCCQCKKGE